MNYQSASFLFGFSIWLLATLVVRYWGHIFLIPNSITILFLYLGAIPFLYSCIQLFFRWLKVPVEGRLKSIVLMAIPGMFCDVFCIQFHELIFPQLSQQQTITLASWVIWAYLGVIIIGKFQVGKYKPA